MNIFSTIESLLFVSGEPLTFLQLAKILGKDEREIETALKTLAEKYIKDETSGLQVVFHEGKVLLTTKSENAESVASLTKASMQENLSKAGLEVLSIIAYRAPISRSAIEAIRGVNCSFTLRNLLLRDLIERQENPTDAREYVYSPTFRFLQSLGLQGICDLPDYATLSVDERLKIIENISDEIPEKDPGKENNILSDKQKTKE